LASVPTYGVDLQAELVTPTGAAIVAASASRFERWPSFAPERLGFGAGKATFADRPNLLRVVLGEPTEKGESPSTHVVLEANVDDMTGELAGYAIAALLDAGALDAWATPVTMKKGRPGLVLSALAPRLAAEAVGDRSAFGQVQLDLVVAVRADADPRRNLIGGESVMAEDGPPHASFLEGGGG
jgi:uncharacterized protein (DUF111 family)